MLCSLAFSIEFEPQGACGTPSGVGVTDWHRPEHEWKQESQPRFGFFDPDSGRSPFPGTSASLHKVPPFVEGLLAGSSNVQIQFLDSRTGGPSDFSATGPHQTNVFDTPHWHVSVLRSMKPEPVTSLPNTLRSFHRCEFELTETRLGRCNRRAPGDRVAEAVKAQNRTLGVSDDLKHAVITLTYGRGFKA